MSQPIRLLVVDDQSLFREGLMTLLSTIDGFEVVGEAADGEQAVREAMRCRPDVVLMDLRMPLMDGVQATRRLRAEFPRARIVVLTTFDDDASIFDAIRAGALGYLLKDADSATLAEAIRRAARDESVLAPKVATRLVNRVASHHPAEPELDARSIDHLTAREREVLALLGRGATNKDIARALDVSEGTTKNHVTSILAKLGVPDRLQAALVARQLGL